MATQPISFDDLGGKQVSLPPTAPGPMSSRARAAAFAQRPAPEPTSPQTQVASAPTPIDFSDLGGRRVDDQPTPPPAEAPQPEDKPGILERAYETSGLKGIIESAKAKSAEEDAFNKELADHIKNRRWGHATEALLTHVVGGALKESYLGPATPFIEGTVKNTYQHGKAAVDAAKQGHIGETIAQTAEAVPVVGQVAEQIGEPLGKDLHDKNYRGVAGDVAGGAAQLALMRGLKGKGGEPAASTEPVAGAPLALGESSPGLVRSGTKLLSKTGTAEKPMGEFMGNRTAAIRSAAEGVSPQAGTPEATGAAVQSGARDVLGNQEQAHQLTKDFTDRAATEVENAHRTATESAGTKAQKSAAEEMSNAQSATEQAGKQAQDEAAQQLHARRTASVEGGKALAKNLSGADELPVPEGDREIISSLRGANESAKAEESAAHNALSEAAKAKGIAVKTQPMQAVAKEVVGLEGPAKDLVMSSLPATVYKTLEKVATNAATGEDVIAGRARDFGWDPKNLSPEQRQNIQKDLADHPSVDSDPNSISEVPYQVMKTARTAVGEALQAARKHFQSTGMGSNAQRVLQQLYGGMSDAMKESLSGDAELSGQFEKANNLTRSRNATFVDPKAVRKMVYADDPGRVMGSVMRSGNEGDVASLRTALEADSTGQGLSRAQRGAMDYILRKSTKSATSDLPSTVRPDAVDYEIAVRNAKSSPALRTLLGDEKYSKFVDDLDAKRIAQRAPEEIALDSQLGKIIKSESPEKAAKIAGKVTEPSEQAQRIAKADTPEKAAKISGFDAEKEPSVQTAQARYAKSKAALDRLRNPSVAEKGVQKVAEHAANELEPSSLIERAAKSPEYTDKLLQVIDKHPQAQSLRSQLGQRIFRNASDNAMVRGAFGSTDGTFDVSKFEQEYNAVRPSLAKVLPPDNLAAMDEFNKALDKYALSKGIGGGAGMTGRFLAIRQLFGAMSMARGLVTASPGTFAAGAAISFGPRVWMELVTHPNLARSFAATLAKGGAAGAISGATWQGKENKRPALQGPDGKPPRWELRGAQR